MRFGCQCGVYGQVCGDLECGSNMVENLRWPIRAGNGSADDVPL